MVLAVASIETTTALIFELDFCAVDGDVEVDVELEVEAEEDGDDESDAATGDEAFCLVLKSLVLAWPEIWP